MSDFIRRQDAIDAIHKEFDEICVWDESGQATANEVENILYEVPSAEPEPKWIPVTEALPKEKEMVLIANKKGHVRCGQYQRTFDDQNCRWWWKHNTLEEVLAWMPLPEPWRGEK